MDNFTVLLPNKPLIELNGCVS